MRPLSLLAPATLLAAILLTVPAATADDHQALGVTPPSVTVDDALPGETYVEYVTLQNEYDSPSTFEASVQGDTEPWTRIEPASPLTVPERTHQRVAIVFEIPDDAYIGTHEGHLSLTGEPKQNPDGTGASVRASVAVQLAVNVGGDAVEELTWIDAHADNAAAGSPIHASVTVANTGNTRTVAEVEGLLKDPDRETPLQETIGTLDLRPGEEKPIELVFPEAVPLGTYEVLVRSTGGAFEERLDAHVVPASDLGKDGTLRYLKHEPTSRLENPLRVDAVFANTGEVTISNAKFHGEVHKDGTLVAVLESESRVLEGSSEDSLSAFFEPSEPGTYTIEGYVNYDGLKTSTKESSVRVAGEPSSPVLSTPLYVVVGLLAALFILVLVASAYRDPGSE